MSSFPAARRKAFVQRSLRGLRFLVKDLWHLERQKRKGVPSLRQKRIPLEGYTGREQRWHVSILYEGGRRGCQLVFCVGLVHYSSCRMGWEGQEVVNRYSDVLWGRRHDGVLTAWLRLDFSWRSWSGGVSDFLSMDGDGGSMKSFVGDGW